MDEPSKILLPKPNFSIKSTVSPKSSLHFLTPSGMTLLPREKQPPPMYGPKGSTVPARFLEQQKNGQQEKPVERHFCEPCEMELRSMEDFRRHREQHERCPVDGCKYKAHPSVMDKHVTELHTSGIFEKIKKISTPEEIAAWREERRKKYPTVANTQMRKMAQEQRQKRGERLEGNKSRFGRQVDRKRTRNVEKPKEERTVQAVQNNQFLKNSRNREKKQTRKIVKTNDDKHPATAKPTTQIESTNELVFNGISMFEGTSKMQDYKHEKRKDPETKNVLSNLLGMYGSDDSDSCNENCDDEGKKGNTLFSESIEDDSKNEIPSEDQKVTIANDTENNRGLDEDSKHNLLHQNETSITCSEENKICDNAAQTIDPTLTLNDSTKNSIECTDVSCDINAESKSVCYSSDEAPEEMPIERTTSIPSAIENLSSPSAMENASCTANNLANEVSSPKRAKLDNPNKREQLKRKYGLEYRKMRIRKQNTMLEKLLEPEIRHERNVLLQCVRFVCQNNFFGIGSKSTTSTNNTS